MNKNGDLSKAIKEHICLSMTTATSGMCNVTTNEVDLVICNTSIMYPIIICSTTTSSAKLRTSHTFAEIIRFR